MSAFLLLSYCGTAGALADYRSEVMADAPAAWWRLDDDAGSAAAVDETGNGDGAYVGGVGLQQAGALPSDSANRSADFNGSDGYCETPFSFNPAATSFTIELWANADAIGTVAGPVLVQQKGASGRALIQVDPSTGKYKTFLGGGSGVLSAVAAPIGDWIHIALVYDKGAGRLQWFFNGAAQGSSVPVAPESETGPILIGRHKTSTNQFWNGRIDEVAIYLKPLAADRIQSHYAAAIAMAPPPAREFYTDPSHPAAHDSNPGTTAAPFATIGRALQEAGPNVTIHIAPGTYAEALHLTKGGQPGYPFALRAAQPGTVILDAPAPVLAGTGRLSSGNRATDVLLKGLVFRNSTPGSGAAAVMPASGWTIDTCRIEGCHAGIRIDAAHGPADGVTVKDTVVEDCPSGGITALGDIPGHVAGPSNLSIRKTSVRRCLASGGSEGSLAAGILVLNGSHVAIEGCTVYDNAGPGISLQYLSSSFTIKGNTIFANHGKEWWSGAGIHIEYSGGPAAVSDSAIRDNFLFSNTGPGVALCESHDITVSGNTMADNGTCVTFRNIYLWNESTTGFSVASDNKLRNLVVTGNKFKSWRREALASWDRSLMKLDDLQGRNVTIASNQYDAGGSGVVFALLDDLPGSPSAFTPLVLNSLSELQAQTSFGAGSSEEDIAVPQGAGFFPATTPGLPPQIGAEGEEEAQADVLDAAAVGNIVVLPLQGATRMTASGGGFEGGVFDLRDHVPLKVVAPNQSAADAFNAGVPACSLWKPLFIRVKVLEKTAYARSVSYDPAEGSGIRDNRVTAQLTAGPAGEDGPTAGVVTLTRKGAGQGSPLEVAFTLAGSGRSGVDYIDPGSPCAIPGGTSRVALSIEPIPNDKADGTRSVVLAVADGAGYYAGSLGSSTVSLEIRDKAFDRWRGEQFQYTGSPPLEALPGADPDGDSYDNLMEFALKGHPLAADAGGLLAVGFTEDDHFSLTYNRPVDLGGITVVPQISSDLVSWSSADVEIVGAEDHGDYLTVTMRDKSARSQNPRRFMRAVISGRP